MGFRLTPVYMVCILIYANFLIRTYNSPFVPAVQKDKICQKNWWANLLYVNNLVFMTIPDQVGPCSTCLSNILRTCLTCIHRTKLFTARSE